MSESTVYKGYEIAYIDYLKWYAILDNNNVIAYADTVEEAIKGIDENC